MIYKMKELKGTQTEKNLLQAFSAESQARNAYTYFASIAKKEGWFPTVCTALSKTQVQSDGNKTHKRQ